ncbi:hypothetical protein L596_028330 [Steinernema carpocapsae]|uniref:Uncharacterized protein n=2 Tax=Steinernema carpocapsae TaxID=34508 RepID=A0A4V5ZXV1_STECR|nr:hypothetical protein L596_028330 [Steinernema carpocapsae]
MKEGEILERLLETFPKCSNCRGTMDLVGSRRPASATCTLIHAELEPNFGCMMEATFICKSCGPQEAKMVAYNTIYQEIYEIQKKYKSALTEICVICDQKCYPDHVFKCKKCLFPGTLKEQLMCGPCAIHNHRGKGHFLASLNEEELEELKKLSEDKGELAKIVEDIVTTLHNQGVSGVFVKPEDMGKAKAALEKAAEQADF